MGLGVLDVKNEHVPGTSNIYEQDDDRSDQIDTTRLKHDWTTKKPTILVPQPSDDPNDPLNWPLWRRDLILAILSFVTVLCTTLSSILAANTVKIAGVQHITYVDAALLTGYHLCGVGIGGIFIVPSARVWGKRHLFLLGHVLMIVSCAWGGASGTNHKSLLWARIFQGVALAPFEGLVNACVGDLYFVHERGKRMAVSNVALFGAAFMTPVIVGKMTVTIGWEWSFYFVAIFLAASLPLMIFFVPETAYRRSDDLNTDFKHKSRHSESTESNLALRDPANDETKSFVTETGAVLGASRTEVTATPIPPEKDSFLRSLRIFTGRKTDEKFWKLLLRPFPLFFHPGILWACLIQGVIIGWAVLIGVILALVFEGPPLWFHEDQVGYLYSGAFIGSMIGLILAGVLTDSMTKFMVKLNHGKYEPEFRILLVAFQLIFACMGLYGFGWTASDVLKYHWLLSDVFFLHSLSSEW